MKIKELKLFTNQLNAEKVFYLETLGFKVINKINLALKLVGAYSLL